MSVLSRDVYQYTECGLNNIWLLDVTKVDEDNDVYVHIPKIKNLHRSIIYVLLNGAHHISGRALRFIRTEMGWTREQFDNMIGFSHRFEWMKNTAYMEDNDVFLPPPVVSILYILWCMSNRNEEITEIMVGLQNRPIKQGLTDTTPSYCFAYYRQEGVWHLDFSKPEMFSSSPKAST